MSAKPIVRWPVMVPLNEVRGAENGAAIAVPSRARPMVLVSSSADGASSLRRVDRLGQVGDQRRGRAAPASRGSRPSSPSSPSGQRRRVGLEAAQVRDQVGAGDAVDGRVVHLREDRDLVVVVPLDHPHLPQRPGAVQRHARRGGRTARPARRSRRAAAARAGARAGRCRSAWSLTQIGWSSSSGTLRSLRRERRDVVRPGCRSRRASRRRSTPSGIVLGSSTIRPHTCMQLRGRLEVEEARVEPGQSVHGRILAEAWNVFSFSTARPHVSSHRGSAPVASTHVLPPSPARHRRPHRQRDPARCPASAPASRRSSPAG